MAKVSNVNTRVYLDEYALSGFISEISMNVEQETPDVTCLSDSGPRRIPANYTHSHSFTGFFDGDDDSVDEIIHNLIADSSDHYLLQLFGANAAGSVAYESIVRLAGKPIVGRGGEAIGLNGDFEGSGHLSRGLVMLNKTVTGTEDGTGYNQGATSAGTVYQAVFRVISGTFSSITLKIQESSDDGSSDAYADISGMSATLTAAGVSRVTTTAATEAWKRATVSAFTGTDAVVLVTAGTVAGT